MNATNAVALRAGLLAHLNTASLPWLKVVLFLALHVGLGLVASQSQALATLHALGVFGFGLWWAATRRLVWVAFIGAYVAGSEVFWRMVSARVPWEFGKYALSFIFLVALVRTRRISGPLLPLLYFALLLPSVWLTMEGEPLSLARQLISFNLSGPFALLVCAWFFSHVQLTPREVHALMLALIAPIFSIFTVAFYTTIKLASAAALVFHGESNFATSGGFGPNQVSSMLGLAALLCFFYLVIGHTDKRHKISMVILMLLFVVQSALTFSRSGLALAIGSGAIAGFYLFRRARSRFAILALAGGLFLFITHVMVPRLNSFTGDAFTERFTSLSTTNRGALMVDELQIWQEHPYLGVGPGMGSVYREQMMGSRVATHTEFTRLLAEHGVLGFLALAALLVACWLNLRRRRGSKERALVATMVAWSLLFLLVNAFRLAAPAFLVGMTFATLWLNDAWVMRVQFSKMRPVQNS